MTLEYIQKQTIQNKRNLESDGTAFRQNLQDIAADASAPANICSRVSMIASLRRAAKSWVDQQRYDGSRREQP